MYRKKSLLIKMPTQNENYSTIKNVCFKAIKTQKTRITGRHNTYNIVYRHLESWTVHTENCTVHIWKKKPPTHIQTVLRQPHTLNARLNTISLPEWNT